MGYFCEYFLESGVTLITLINLFVCLLTLHTLESLLYVVPSVVMTYTYRFCMACNFSKGIKKHQARSGYFR